MSFQNILGMWQVFTLYTMGIVVGPIKTQTGEEESTEQCLCMFISKLLLVFCERGTRNDLLLSLRFFCIDLSGNKLLLP